MSVAADLPITLAACASIASPSRIRIGDVAVLPGSVDWPLLVSDIKTAMRFTHDSQVADLLNMPRTTLAGWMYGSEPLYTHGAALFELHCRAAGGEKTLARLLEFKERARRPASNRTVLDDASPAHRRTGKW